MTPANVIYGYIANAADLSDLYNKVVQPHNNIHNIVGGTMGTLQSPYDPFFMVCVCVCVRVCVSLAMTSSSWCVSMSETERERREREMFGL